MLVGCSGCRYVEVDRNGTSIENFFSHIHLSTCDFGGFVGDPFGSIPLYSREYGIYIYIYQVYLYVSSSHTVPYNNNIEDWASTDMVVNPAFFCFCFGVPTW